MKFKFDNSFIRFKITSNDISEILSFNSLINSSKNSNKFAKVNTKDGKIVISVSSKVNKNYFEKEFDCEVLGNMNGKFQIYTNTFENLPSKKDYIVEINGNDQDDNYMKFNWDIMEEDKKLLNLDIFVGAVKV